MLSKITRSKILFVAVLLVIVPIMVSAAGNREAGNGNGITLDTEVMALVNGVADRNVSLDEAQSGLLSLESKYQIKAATMEKFQKILEDINSGKITAASCEEQVGALVRNRVRNQDQGASAVKKQLQTDKSSGQGKPAAKQSGKN